jgi:hypothetical protein
MMKNNTNHKRYELGNWREYAIQSWWAHIYVGGDINTAQAKCRELCFPDGLCVTIEPVEYYYAGGSESGYRIGLIQYPPFPESEDDLYDNAVIVGRSVAEANYQWSFTIVTPHGNFFHSRKINR